VSGNAVSPMAISHLMGLDLCFSPLSCSRWFLGLCGDVIQAAVAHQSASAAGVGCDGCGGMRWVRWDAMGAVGCCRRAAAEISGITGHRAKEANGGV